MRRAPHDGKGRAQAFGAAVRAARASAGIAQEELAYLAGVERSHLGKVERGEHMPTLGIVLKIAKALGISAADLVQATEVALPMAVLRLAANHAVDGASEASP